MLQQEKKRTIQIQRTYAKNTDTDTDEYLARRKSRKRYRLEVTSMHVDMPESRRSYEHAQVRQALGLFVVLLFVAGLLTLVLLVEWLENYLENDLGLS